MSTSILGTWNVWWEINKYGVDTVYKQRVLSFLGPRTHLKCVSSWHGSYLIRKLLKFAGKVLDLETMGGGILDYCWLRRCHFVWIQVYRTPEDPICFGLILWVPSGLRTDDLLGNQMLLKFFLCGWSTWWILISMYMYIYISSIIIYMHMFMHLCVQIAGNRVMIQAAKCV